LRRCLASILECTDFDRFDVKILVGDDGSSEHNLEANKSVLHEFCTNAAGRGVAEMLMSSRTGIASTWNRIVRHDVSKRDVVVLVNDDVEVVDDWLDILAFSVLENPNAGMIGLNTYPGQIKEAAPKQMRVDYVEAHLLDGDGALVSSHGPIFGFSRSVYDAVGGFDERYFCFYEEVDFGVALRTLGYDHYMASYPICYHMGGATNSDPRNLDAAKCMAESRAKFVEKWGCGFDGLRRGFAFKFPKPLPREWNTQLKNWRDA